MLRWEVPGGNSALDVKCPLGGDGLWNLDRVTEGGVGSRGPPPSTVWGKQEAIRRSLATSFIRQKLSTKDKPDTFLDAGEKAKRDDVITLIWYLAF